MEGTTLATATVPFDTLLVLVIKISTFVVTFVHKFIMVASDPTLHPIGVEPSE